MTEVVPWLSREFNFDFPVSLYPIFWRHLQEYRAGAETLTPAPYQNIELTHNDRQIGTILSDFRAAR